MIGIFLTAVFALFVGTAIGPGQAWSGETELPWVVDPGQKVVWGRGGWLDNDRVAFIGDETEGKSLTGNRLKVWNTRTGEITGYQTDVASLCVNEHVFGYYRVPSLLPDYWAFDLRVPFWLHGGWYRGRFPEAHRVELRKELSDSVRCVVSQKCQPGVTERMAFKYIETVVPDFTNCRILKVNLDLPFRIPLREGDGELLTGTLPKKLTASSQNYRLQKEGAADSFELPIPVVQAISMAEFYPFKGAYFLHREQDFRNVERDSGKFSAPWPAWWLWPSGRVERLDVPRGLTGPAFPTKLGLLHAHYDSSRHGKESGIYLFLSKGPVEVFPSVFSRPQGPPMFSPDGCKVAFVYQRKLRLLNLCRHREAIEQLPVYRFKYLKGPAYRVPVK